jgi:hypothetical protein
MIARIWHGWIKPENADAYEKLLKEEIFTGIAGRKILGYRGSRDALIALDMHAKPPASPRSCG